MEVNMFKELEHLHVNGDDIAWAKSQDRWACAIVRAIQREIPESTFVRADTEVIAYSVGGHRYTHPTPDVAIQKIIKPLDQGKAIRPFGFDLPPAVQKQTTRLTPEAKKALRNVDRNRSKEEKDERRDKDSTRTHNRFCEIPDAR